MGMTAWLHRRDPEWLARAGDVAGLARVLAEDDVDVRRRAVQAFLDLAAQDRGGASAAAPALAGALRDPDRVVRSDAALALGSIGDPGAADAVAALLADPDGRTALAAAVALAALKDVRGLPLLVEVYRAGPAAGGGSFRAASEALVALGRRASAPFVEMLRDGDPEVRRAAAGVLQAQRWRPRGARQQMLYAIARQDWSQVVEELRAADVPRAVADLVAARLDDPDVDVRLAAAVSLALAGDARGADRLGAEHGGIDGVRALLDRCAGSLAWRADMARLALDLLGVGIVRSLLWILGSSGDERRHRPAEQALARLGEEALEPVVAALGDVEPRRSAAVTVLRARRWQPTTGAERAAFAAATRDWKALANLGRAGLPYLVSFLQDPDQGVRVEAVATLAGLHWSSAAEPLLAALTGDPDPRVRAVAARGLAELEDPRALDALLDARHESAWDIRVTATDGLARLAAKGEERALRPALEMLESSDHEVRAGAAPVLVRLGAEHAFAPLVGALHDDHPTVREAAATALGALGDARAVEPLVTALVEDPPARAAAAQALGTLGDRSAVPGLVAALVHPDGAVRLAAAGVLTQLGWSPSGPDEQAARAVAARDWRAAVAAGAAAVPRLVDVAAGPGVDDRLDAAVALARLGDARAVGPLAELATQYGQQMPALAASVDKAREVADGFIARSDDDMFYFEIYARDCACAEDAYEACLTGLRRAVTALGRLGAPARAALLELAESTVPAVRERAEAALRKAGERPQLD